MYRKDMNDISVADIACDTLLFCTPNRTYTEGITYHEYVFEFTRSFRCCKKEKTKKQFIVRKYYIMFILKVFMAFLRVYMMFTSE